MFKFVNNYFKYHLSLSLKIGQNNTNIPGGCTAKKPTHYQNKHSLKVHRTISQIRNQNKIKTTPFHNPPNPLTAHTAFRMHGTLPARDKHFFLFRRVVCPLFVSSALDLRQYKCKCGQNNLHDGLRCCGLHKCFLP